MAFSIPKSTMLKANVALASFALILIIASSFSGWGSTNGIKNVAWGELESTPAMNRALEGLTPGNSSISVQVYFGLEYYVIVESSTDTEKKISYDDYECNNLTRVSNVFAATGVNLTDTCDNCRSSISGLEFMKYTNLLSHIAGVFSAASRLLESQNSEGNRYFSMATAILGVILSIGGVASFKQNCYDNAPDVGFTSTLGPAFVLVIMAFLVDILLAMFHAMSPHNSQALYFEGTPFNCCCYGKNAICYHGPKAKWGTLPSEDFKGTLKNQGKQTSRI